MKALTTLLTAAAVLALSSCGIYGRYERPALDLELGDGTPVRTVPWQERFQDPFLKDLIDTALANSTDLAVAMLKVEEARADLYRTRMAFLPSLDASATGDIVERSARASLNASWQADIFGKLRNANLAALSSLEGQAAYSQAVRCALIASVASSYYNLLALDSQLRISTSTLENWDKTISVLEALKMAGKTNDVAILQAKARKMNLESSSMRLRKNITTAENALRALAGKPDLEIRRGSMDGCSFPESMAEGVPLGALAARPDVRRAESALATAFYNTAAAKAAFYPDITLRGSSEWLSASASDLAWSAIGSLAAPLLNRGIFKAGLKAARARQEEARLQFRQTLIDAGTEVNNALAEYYSAQERIETDSLQCRTLSDAVEKIELMMHYSTTNYLEVLTAQQSLLDSELTLVNDKLALADAWVALYQALGGGSGE